MKTIQQIVTMIEGFIALCLGSSDRIVWVNQTDAAAFSDDGKIFLPQPCGLDGEFELLLGIALREVAKLTFSNPTVFACMSPNLLGYASAIEDARIKQEISATYNGAASVFDAATSVMRRINTEKIGECQPDPEMIKQLAIWAAANDAYLGTSTSSAAASEFAELAASCVDANKLATATGISQAAPWLKSTSATAQCATRIQVLLAEPVQQPENEPQSEKADDQDQDQGKQQAQDNESAQKPENESQSEKADDQDQDKQAQDSESEQKPEQTQDADSPSQEAESSSQADPSANADNQSTDSEPQGEPDETGNTSGQSESEEVNQGSEQSSPELEAKPDGTQQPDGEQGADPGQAETPESDVNDQTQGNPAGSYSSDAMSNALARLKGHKGATAARDLTEEQQQANGMPVAEELVAAILQALQQSDAMDQLDVLALAMTQEPPVVDDDTDQLELDVLDVLCQSGMGSGGLAASNTMDGTISLGAMPSRLVSVLLREFQEQRPKPLFRCQSGRDLSVSHLWRLRAVGDTKVFRKKAPSTGVSAAVHLLLDRSGSMEDDIGLAANATNAFALALQRISGVQTAISLFPGGDKVVQDVLQFRQNCIHATNKLRTVTADGDTPTDWAISEILPKLLNTPVEKRVIVLITDGRPDSVIRTKAVIAQANALGVDVIGIGIGRACIEEIISRSVSIQSIAELPSALEKLFKTELSSSLLST